VTDRQATSGDISCVGHRKVLVIDDDAGLRAVLQLLLEDEGFTTCAADSEHRGLAAAASEDVDLIITDGFHFRPPFGEPQSGWLRELGLRASGVPVVLLTGYTEATRLNPAAFGLATIITKPFELDALCAAVHTALGRPSTILPEPTGHDGQRARAVTPAR
jgi:DNA-binding NtrC family response regulator